MTAIVAAVMMHLFTACAQGKDEYTKLEKMIPMRDGVKLYTAVYIPKETGTEPYPILMHRTPYSCAPYGDKIPRRFGPGNLFSKEKYIYVYQDVRGRYMSEGKFQEMTPAIDKKKSNKEVDESSDTYDTIEWLLHNVNNNNGKVGIYGISYPGFYATASLPGAHPAIKAVSPQAPVTDEFEGDDANHRGAFFLLDNFSFLNYFDYPRGDTTWQDYPSVCDTLKIKPDAYTFYLGIGPIKNLDKLYFHGKSVIWNEYLEHSTKDAYWQARNIRTHLNNIQPAVLVVGGWFDAEDMFGALKTYEAIEKQSPNNNNRLVMGPWTHGAWARGDWKKFGGYDFDINVNEKYQQLEYNFFTWYLKGKGSFNEAEATVFVTGSNEWKGFEQWPPKAATAQKWYLGADHQLNTTPYAANTSYDAYVSDPANPVPYIDRKSSGRINEYMTADQTFAAERKDVLHYKGMVLPQDLTVCGHVTAQLYASTTGTDADFVVKLIDVLPDGKQQLVRAEVIRGKFRNSFVKPEAFVPNKVTPVTLELNDVAHTFKAGHQLMVQVQSSWFPLVDRNPQKFVNIPEANASDFQKATIKLYHDKKYPSNIEIDIL